MNITDQPLDPKFLRIHPKHYADEPTMGNIELNDPNYRENPVGEKVMFQWTETIPDFACVFVARREYDYSLWKFEWQIGEPPEGGDDDTTYWYLAWEDADGEEYGDIADYNFGEILVIELLPTMEQTNEMHNIAELKRGDIW